MTLVDTLNQDYITAFKNRETDKVNVLRLLMSALKNEVIKIGGLGTVLTDEQALTVLNREAKQRKDSIAQYSAGNRPDLADKEQAELALIEAYLPKAMDETELAGLVNQILTETSATQKSDMGKVMAALKAKIANPADVSRAAALVSQKLA